MKSFSPEPHACKNCAHVFEGKYCNACGEKVYTSHDRNILHFLEEGLHFITHFEGTFFNTLKALGKPGKLSADFCEGRRKKYFKPLSFFLLLVVLYLLFPIFEGLNMRLHFYLQQPLYGGYATGKVNELLEHKHISMPALEELFHHKSEKISKFLLFIIIPLTALFFLLLTFKKRPFFYDQVIFATEINIVFLLWGFLLLPLCILIISVIYHWISGNSLSWSENSWQGRTIGITMYAVICAYTSLAIRRFYALRRWQSVLAAVLFSIVHVLVIQYLYKMILFFIVIHLIH
jgi:hypothetical protein